MLCFLMSVSEWVSKSIYTQHIKIKKVATALQPRQTEMSLKVISIAPIQHQAIAM